MPIKTEVDLEKQRNKTNATPPLPISSQAELPSIPVCRAVSHTFSSHSSLLSSVLLFLKYIFRGALLTTTAVPGRVPVVELAGTGWNRLCPAGAAAATPHTGRPCSALLPAPQRLPAIQQFRSFVCCLNILQIS